MKLQPFLMLLFLIVISDMVAAAIGAYSLWCHKRYNGVARMSRRVAILLGAVFVEGLFLLIANAFGYVFKPVFTPEFAWFYWIGRTTRSVALWYFVLYILGYRSGPRG